MTDQALLTEYLSGKISSEEKNKLEKRLQEEPELQKALEETRFLLGLIDQMPEEEPEASLRSAFLEQLEQEKARTPVIRSLRPWQSAAAAALLVLGVGIGILYQHNRKQALQINTLAEQVHNTQRLLALSMLEQPSAAQRIKAMNTIQQEVTQSNPDVVDALIDRMRTDEHVNVRMRAAEALRQFADHPNVIPALTNQLEAEKHPQVLFTLIDVLVALRVRPAAPAMQEIIDSPEQPEVVRDRAAYGVGQLL